MSYRSRVYFSYLCIFSLFITLIFQIFYLYQNQEVAKNSNIKQVKKKHSRINILDREDQVLATNLATHSLYASPTLLKNISQTIKGLKSIFPNIDVLDLVKKLSNKNNPKKHFLIKRDLTNSEKRKVKNLGYIGLSFHQDNKRLYPHNNILSHIIGFSDKDENGQAGFEKYYDKYLKKQDYQNNNINLSINLNIQNSVYHHLKKAIENSQSSGGTAIVMNVNNFEIYSLVSLPDYDPYNPVDTLHNINLNNKASYALHEMGSSFKTFTMALALDRELIKLEEKFDVSQKIMIDNYIIKDSHRHNILSAKEIFSKSSNIGTAKIAQKFAKNMQKEFFQDLGFFKPLNVELIEKNHHSIPKKWSLAKTITTSYGYGISVTALHLTQALAAMVNGGILKDATLIKNSNKNKIGEKIIYPKTSKKILELLTEVVNNGTGRRARSKIYKIGGKTGTAYKVKKKTGYDKTAFLSSFFGVFPINKPEYIIFSFLDNPKKNKTNNFIVEGGNIVAPMVKNIIEEIGPILNVAPIR